MDFIKGDKVKVTGNSIFQMMGFNVVTGEVFLVRNGSIHIKCKETRAIEICDIGDGKIEKTS